MDTNKQEMEIMHKMCQKELRQLQVKLSVFLQESDRIQKLLNGRKVVSKDGRTCVTDNDHGAGSSNNMFALIAFDRYMSQVGIVVNMARKFNIHLEINKLTNTIINPAIGSLEGGNETQSRILQDYMEWTNTRYEQDEGNNSFYDSNSVNGAIGPEITECLLWKKDNSSTSISREEVVLNKNALETSNSMHQKESVDTMMKLENFLKILLPIKSLKRYKEGHEFSGSITYVYDYKNLVFFIFDMMDYEFLYEFSNSQNLTPIQRSSLSDALFCVSQNYSETVEERECVWRAVMVPEEGKDSKDAVYLIDFGEIIALTDQCKLYKAPLKCSQTHPLAIKCILRAVHNSHNIITKDHEQCKQALRSNEYKMVQFRVVKQENSVLLLDLIEKPSKEIEKPSKDIEKLSKEMYRQQSSCQTVKCTNSNPFLNTTHLFDGEEGNSENNLDPLPLPISAVYSVSSLSSMPTTQIAAEVGNQLQILVTHIVSPIAFYAIIENTLCDQSKTLSWPDNDISTNQKQIPPPKVNDIVLSQYIKDNYWYRAKIIDILPDKDLYKVFYVDFGNTEIVPKSCLASCTKQQLEDPLRAVLFNLADLYLLSENDININSSFPAGFCFERAIATLVASLLDASLNVEVVERHKDVLVVHLTEQQYAYIPELLIAYGVVLRRLS